jgi:hypothetical protein
LRADNGDNYKKTVRSDAQKDTDMFAKKIFGFTVRFGINGAGIDGRCSCANCPRTTIEHCFDRPMDIDDARLFVTSKIVENLALLNKCCKTAADGTCSLIQHQLGNKTVLVKQRKYTTAFKAQSVKLYTRSDFSYHVGL